jgi:homoserine dehydrogenase
MKTVNIGLLGLGNIGTGTYKTLEMNREQIESFSDIDLRITKILEKDTARNRDIPYPQANSPRIQRKFSAILPSVVIELLGGIEPATTFMLDAMEKR